MIFPLDISDYIISSPFGERTHPVTGAYSFHNGIDIAVPEGTPVYAPSSGIVSGWLTNDTGGNQMVIKLANGWKVGFAHLHSRLVEPNEPVSAGQLIARTGETGNATGPHLHLTVKDPTGAYVDPEKVLWQGRSVNTNRKNLAWLIPVAIATIGVYLIYEDDA